VGGEAGHDAEMTRPATTSASGLFLPLGRSSVTVEEVVWDTVDGQVGNTEKIV
jgi:hypothetical protein